MMRRITRRAFLATVGAAIASAGISGVPVIPVRADEPVVPPADGDAPFVPTTQSTLAVDLSQVSNLTVRATLSTTYFTSLDHAEAQVTANGTYRIVNAYNGAVLKSGVAAGTVYVITNSNGYLKLMAASTGSVVGSYTGPLLVQPEDHAREVQLRSVDRGSPYGNPYYRGYLEVKQSTTAGMVRVVNVLEASWLADPLEKYLYGVVPMEMPVDYGLEALKAQAVAARTYATSRYNGSYVDVTDSTSTQVYYGYAVESTNSSLAVDGTRGVVATYNGAVISALYSACCGGHTEHNENVYFSRVSGGTPAPYLRGVRCYGDGSWADISSDSAAKSFWGTTPDGYCDWSSGLYRWPGWTWGRIDLEAILNRYLPDLPTNYISRTYTAGALGELRELTVLERGVSGKIKRFRVKNSVGAYWDVYSDYYTRYVLRTGVGYGLQFSSNMVFYPNYSGSTLVSISVKGGGWGHGVGLCQRGARGMANDGKSYNQILSHYYTGITLQGGRTPPAAPTPVAPTDGKLFLPSQSVTLAWTGSGTSYQAQLFNAVGGLLGDSGWFTGTSWNLGTLPIGDYKWYVRAQNANGTGDWCPWQHFHVVSKIYKGNLPLVRNE